MRGTFEKYGNLKYVFSVPDDFSEDSLYPAIILLHGAGCRGNDLKLLSEHPYFRQTEEYSLEAVTFPPLCSHNTWFDIFEQLQDFVEEMLNSKFVDRERCYIVGASMGGYATWQLAMSLPELFAAIIPICGGGMCWNAGRLKNMAVWAFHGSDDKTVTPDESRKMADAVNRAGGNARLTVYESVGHSSWENVFSDRMVFEWLFRQKAEKA